MAALTGPRNTEKLGGGDICPLPSYPVAASTTIYAGALVGLNSAGYLVPMSGTGQRVVGIANETVDNSSGANGDKTCGADTGVYRMVNDGTNTVTLANVGAGATILQKTIRPSATFQPGLASRVNSLASLAANCARRHWLFRAVSQFPASGSQNSGRLGGCELTMGIR